MLRSEDRILTTHTGSLPRPAALTSLYVRRSRGEAIDAAELDREGKAAVREVVAKQIAAGVDIPNNGEQQREAFFLYVRHRMSGFGGGWTRKVFADVTHYPAFMAWKAAHDAVNESISNVGGIPEAVGEVRYLDRAPVEAECADFRAALDAVQGRYAEPFMTAPSPGIIAAAMRNAWYDSEDA
jgi:5-methyltetrahydropteroyltriglutamate--homocysteine methyltransferase